MNGAIRARAVSRSASTDNATNTVHVNGPGAAADRIAAPTAKGPLPSPKHNTVRAATSERKRLHLANPCQHRRYNRWRCLQADPVEMHVRSLEGHLLTTEQPPHHGDHFLQGAERRRRTGTHLLHPILYAVPDPAHNTPRCQRREGGEFHGRDCRVAGNSRKDPQTHVQAFGARQRRGCKRDSGREEAIFDDPKVVYVGTLQGFCHLNNERGRERAVKTSADCRLDG
jgi:hypothetical protein